MRVVLITAAMLLGAVRVVAAECGPGDEEAMRWLDRMSHSLRETSYRGVFTYQHGTAVQTMRISHSVRGRYESEQLTHLTGTSARVIRTQHPLDCIHPGHRLVRIGQLYGNAQADGEGECGIGAHYRLQMAGELRVAGREAVAMNVMPRDSYRYGYQIALDRETGLLLKTQTVNREGQVLERFQFADVRIGDVEDDGTRVEVLHEAAHAHGSPQPQSASGGPRWTVSWLPCSPNAWR